VLSALLVGSWACSIPPAASGFQFNPKLDVSTEQPSYAGNATIVVSGSITVVQGFVIISIRNPSGTLISSVNGDIDEYSGLYQAEIKAGGPGWTESGKYNVTATWQYCPTTVSNSTSFIYTSAATGLNNRVTTSTQLSASATSCDSSTSTTGAPSKADSSSSQSVDSLLNSTTLPIVVVALVVVLLVATIVVVTRLRGRERT